MPSASSAVLAGGVLVAVDQADGAAQPKEDGVQQAGLVEGDPLLQPAAAVQPLLLSAQPAGVQLGQGGLVHLKDHLHRMALDVCGKTAVGAVGFVVLAGVEDGAEPGQALGVGGDAGDGLQLFVGVAVKALLQRAVRAGVDPVVLHLLEGGAGEDLVLQGEELVIARHKGQAAGYGVQRAGFVLEVGPELGQLQPAPGIAGLFLHALLGIAAGLVQPAAVGQGAGVAVIPGPAAGGKGLGVGHPRGRAVIIQVLPDVVAGVCVPQGDLQVLTGLLLGEAALAHALLDELVEMTQHPVKVAGVAFGAALEKGDVFGAQQRAGLGVKGRQENGFRHGGTSFLGGIGLPPV